MPANYRDATALAFDPEQFHQLLDKARTDRGHSWVDLSRETGVGLDVFRRLREGATPRLDQYLSMAAYIRAHTAALDETALTHNLIAASGNLYTEAKPEPTPAGDGATA